MIRRVASISVAFLAASALLVWIAGAPILSALPSAVKPMNPATALALGVAAIALWLLEPGASAARTRAARALGGLVGAIGLVRLVGYAFEVEVGIDQVLFRDRLGIGPFAPNRMAPNTAVGLVLVGAALASNDWETKRGHRPAEGVTILVLALTLFVLVGYSYAERAMVAFPSYTPMSLPTAVAIVMLCVGMLSARERGGLAEAFRGTSVASVGARRLLVAVFVVPWLIGWLRIRGQAAGLYDTELGTALFTVTTMLMLAGITWWTIGTLGRMERKRREAERKLRKSERRARAILERFAAANAELESFSYSVSHDLRAPLRAIEGYGRILVDDHARALDAEGHRVLDVIRENARQMGRLIDDLLAFSRVGRKELEGAPIDMQELVHAVVREVETRRASQASVRVSIGGLPPAWGDHAMVRQVIVNLVDNAWKFSRTSPDPSVEIEGGSDGAMLTYVVRDNGVGFEMEYAARIFGVFQRLHRAEEYEGTGVGLAIVDRIVKRHGGRIWAEGVPGKGATFRFSLPAPGAARRRHVESSG